MASPGNAYVMGHTDRERRRLSVQAAVLNPLTDSFLRRAGISAGMNVLEFGCGVGEVSLIAARLVGPQGSVHALDIDAGALDVARDRIRSAGHDHVIFEQADIHARNPAQLYDAVIGRHILIHTPDALAILKKAVSLIHVGGVIAFQEYDLSRTMGGYPDLPMMTRIADTFTEFFTRAVPCANVGAQLPHLLHLAGLTTPECRAESIVSGGPHSPFYEWFVETFRSLQPRMKAIGMTVPDVDLDLLPGLLRAEAVEKGAFTSGPLMYGAFARKPA
jgi:SAM-dependent methyltransferase